MPGVTTRPGRRTVLYHYVGSRAMADRVRSAPRGPTISSPADLARWAFSNGARGASEITVTFIISEAGELLVADRHSEHVACAGGRLVRAAGELCFVLNGDRVTVTRVSNQS